MSALHELYHELILDHGRNPRYFGELSGANRMAEGFNPLCGDKLKIYMIIDLDTDTIRSIRFDGVGCAISMASASMMVEALQGKKVSQAKKMFNLFCKQVTLDVSQSESDTYQLGKLAVLSGVRRFPSRVKCATLAWHTLENALNQSSTTSSTE